jgi:hypothetical protein
MSLTPELLQSVARELGRLTLDPDDARVVAGMVGSQQDGLARLDELDLAGVEPAVALDPDAETAR